MAARHGGGRTLETLNFDNATLRHLPTESADPAANKHARPAIPGYLFSRVDPTPVDKPIVVAVSEPATGLLELDTEQVNRADFKEYFAGNKILPGSEPAAHIYCGYQFGNFAGQLGDGAAMYLGETVNSKGQRWELQLKGAGPTPCSRQGDGRKVLRSSIREFLASEYMHGLGIPTTRAATLITSDSRVIRDEFYDGNPIAERCTIVSRLAPTFLRFGSFEVCLPVNKDSGRAGPSQGMDRELLVPLADHVISTHYQFLWDRCKEKTGLSDEELRALDPTIQPEAAEGDTADADPAAAAAATLAPYKREMYSDFFDEVAVATARLVARWQAVGFTHGVLNTDNMSILGLTIDYGPYGFMERYDPGYVPNHSDDGGRYAFAEQPAICSWNLQRLAEALSNLCPALKSPARLRLEQYWAAYKTTYHDLLRKKLGLLNDALARDRSVEEADIKLIEALFETMKVTGCDFSEAFRALALVPMLRDAEVEKASPKDLEDGSAPLPIDRHLTAALDAISAACAAPDVMAEALKPRISPEQLPMLLQLASREPRLLQMMGISVAHLESESDRHRLYREALSVTAEEKKARDRAEWTVWLRTYLRRLRREREMGGEDAPDQRLRAMSRANPRIVLRPWILQNAIDKAEKGDHSEVQRILQFCRDPFTSEELPAPPPPEPERVEGEEEDGGPASGGGAGGGGADGPVCQLRYDGPSPAWGTKIVCSCSS